MDTYKVVIIDMNGHQWTPKYIRAQSIVTLRKRLIAESKRTGGYVKMEIIKQGSKKVDMLEMGWDGGFNWYSNLSTNGRKWDKVSRVGSDGRLI